MPASPSATTHSDTTGLTADAGWQIGVSRTVAADLERTWALLTSPAGVALWLGPGATLRPEPGSTFRTDEGSVGEVRTVHHADRIRLRLQASGRTETTVVQVSVRPTAGGTAVRFHQERLSDAGERAAQRGHWKTVLDAVERALAADVG